MSGKAQTFLNMAKSGHALRAQTLRPSTVANGLRNNQSVFDMKNDTKERGYYGNLDRAKNDGFY